MEGKKLKKFNVECVIRYYGQVEVQAEDSTCAVEQADKMLDGTIHDDFPDKGVFGGVNFVFAHAEAEFAEEIKEDPIEDTDNVYRKIVAEIAEHRGVVGFKLNPDKTGFSDLSFNEDGQLIARHASNHEGLFTDLGKDKQKELVKFIL